MSYYKVSIVLLHKQSHTETIEQLLIGLDAFRAQLTKLGEPISDAQYRMIITKAVKPDIIKQVTNQTNTDSNLYQQWPFEYFRQQLRPNTKKIRA